MSEDYRNFRKIAEGINVKPLLSALKENPELWNQHNQRTKYPGSKHTLVDDIWLRFYDITKDLAPREMLEDVFNDLDAVDYPAFKTLAAARQIVFDVMRLVEGYRLGRVIIARLKPFCHIPAHIDGGANAEHYDRYHVLLQSGPVGYTFRCGDETVSMKPGECWWFDNKQEHEVHNNSHYERLTMILDIRCK